MEQISKLNDMTPRSKGFTSTNRLKQKDEKKDISGLESDKEDEQDQKKKKAYKKPNVGDLNDAIKRSRNAKAKIKYEKKTRISSGKEGDFVGLSNKMLKNFPKPEKNNDPVYSQDSPSRYEDNSPAKDYNSNPSLLNQDLQASKLNIDNSKYYK